MSYTMRTWRVLTTYFSLAFFRSNQTDDIILAADSLLLPLEVRLQVRVGYGEN